MLLAGDVFATLLHDVNGNGIKDTEEPPLQGWTVFVDYDRDSILDATEPSGITNIDGESTITGIPKGTWDVRQVLEPGWAPSAGFDVVDRVGVNDNQTTDVLFMNVPAANGGIAGTVWEDVNGDGIRQAEDGGLPGWIVFLDDNGNNARLDAANGPSSRTQPATMRSSIFRRGNTGFVRSCRLAGTRRLDRMRASPLAFRLRPPLPSISATSARPRTARSAGRSSTTSMQMASVQPATQAWRGGPCSSIPIRIQHLMRERRPS